MIKTIYLDMDGVFVDFYSEYERMFGEVPSYTSSQDRSANLEKFINNRGFETAPMMPNAKKFFHIIREVAEERNIDLQFLTSDGGLRNMRPATHEQKINWLQNNGLWLGESKFILSQSWKGKLHYASPTSMLIDDTSRNCQGFMLAGGKAVLYFDNDLESVFESVGNILS